MQRFGWTEGRKMVDLVMDCVVSVCTETGLLLNMVIVESITGVTTTMCNARLGLSIPM